MASTQQCLLERELKITHWTERASEDRLQMLNRLQDRIALGTVRRFASPAQAGANPVQALSQPLDQVIHCLQGQAQSRSFMAGLERGSRKPRAQHLPEQRRVDGVARQHLREEHRKCFAATSPLPAVGTKDPLAALAPAIAPLRIVAVKNAVPV